MISPLRIAGAVLVVVAAMVATTGAQSGEYVTVQKVMNDQAIVIRANGATYRIEKGVGCLSLSRYEGKRVFVTSPGLFLGVGSKIVIPDLGQECRIWTSEQIESPRSTPPQRAAPVQPAKTSLSLADLEGSIILATDGRPLGLITTNCFKAEALCNEFGQYGNSFNANSILNEFGQYGNEFSAKSPFNEFTSTPPKIFKDDKAISYLSRNAALTPRVDPLWLLGALKIKREDRPNIALQLTSGVVVVARVRARQLLEMLLAAERGR